MPEIQRGKFIVFEGLDCSGKTTQSELLVESLKQSGHEAKLIVFPRRETKIGKVIDEFLKGPVAHSSNNENHVPNKPHRNSEAIHLLFSLDRWKAINEMKQSLESGVHIICDRYSFSNIAYSTAANNLPYSWCAIPEEGLLCPDLVIYLDLNPDVAKQRKGFGQEVYEKEEIQKKIREAYKRFRSFPFWKELDGGRDLGTVEKDVLSNVLTTISSLTIEFRCLEFPVDGK